MHLNLKHNKGHRVPKIVIRIVITITATLLNKTLDKKSKYFHTIATQKTVEE